MALATLKTTKITGAVTDIIGDGADPDDNPDDTYGFSGTITFTPSVSEVTLTAENPPRKAHVRPVVCTVDDPGFLTFGGLRSVRLVSSTNPGKIRGGGGFRTGWTWRVDYDIKQGGTPVPFDSYDFIADQDDDLAKLTPVDVTPLVTVLKGEPGTPGGGGGDGTVTTVNALSPDATGNLSLNLDNIPAGTVALQFTAAKDSKLAGIEAGANLVTDAEIQALADTQIANSTTVIRTTGAQTVAGVKTFSSAPVVPANAFPVTAINGLAQFIRDTVEAAYGRIAVVRSYTGTAWEPEAVASDVEAFVLYQDVYNQTTTAPPVRTTDTDQQMWLRRDA